MAKSAELRRQLQETRSENDQLVSQVEEYRTQNKNYETKLFVHEQRVLELQSQISDSKYNQQRLAF